MESRNSTNLGTLAREAGPAVGDQRLGGQSILVPRTTKIFILARIARRRTQRRHPSPGMRGNHILDLVGIDVEAGRQDHVLLAIDDADKALLVDGRHVAGTQVAVG